MFNTSESIRLKPMYLTIKLDVETGDSIKIGGDRKFINELDIENVIEYVFKYMNDLSEHSNYNERNNSGGFIFKLSGRSLKVVYKIEDNICDFLILDGDIEFDDIDGESIDSLTELGNKKLFIKDLKMILNENRKNIQIYLLDIDNFSRINEIVGKLNSDDVLLQIRDRIFENVISNHTLYRFEGDCFAIIREGLREDRFINQLTNIFEEPFVTKDDNKTYISVSIGYVNLSLDEDRNIESLLEKAQIALNHSKENGKGLVNIYKSSIKERNRREMELEGMIREALKENQFYLNYQPQFSMEQKKMVGAEALIRWNHPVHGFISPGEFIPIAEKNGLIVPIGEWVLKEACRQQREWKNKGLPTVKIGVNIGSLHFKKENFVNDVVSRIKEYDLDYTDIGLEITEGSVIEDAEDMVNKLEALKDLGINISIDDFGTGYSSLSYLKRFKIDTLKIDQSFVINMPDKNEDIAIVRAIIDIAKNLNIKVIAEGVETERVVKLLMDMDCSDMQGYLFSKPKSKQEFEILLKGKDNLINCM